MLKKSKGGGKLLFIIILLEAIYGNFVIIIRVQLFSKLFIVICMHMLILPLPPAENIFYSYFFLNEVHIFNRIVLSI